MRYHRLRPNFSLSGQATHSPQVFGETVSRRHPQGRRSALFFAVLGPAGRCLDRACKASRCVGGIHLESGRMYLCFLRSGRSSGATRLHACQPAAPFHVRQPRSCCHIARDRAPCRLLLPSPGASALVQNSLAVAPLSLSASPKVFHMSRTPLTSAT